MSVGNERFAVRDKLDLGQRVVVVVGWAGVLAFFGEWVSTLHGYSYVAIHFTCPTKEHCLSIGSAPTMPVETGLHPWAVMLVWIGLTVLWISTAVWMVRAKPVPAETE